MRFDPTSELTAADIVNDWTAEELADVIYRYGEEHRSRRIARAIVQRGPAFGALACFGGETTAAVRIIDVLGEETLVVQQI